MTPNEQTIIKLYDAFQKKDFRTMSECYHEKATFKDAAFDLKTGAEVRAMWEMLCKQGKDLKIEYSKVSAIGKIGSAHWEAYYTFSKTGRKVHNSIDASFEFVDGLIIKHIDSFDFYKWSRQALGVAGLLLGFTDFFHKKVQKTAAEALQKFMKTTNL